MKRKYICFYFLIFIFLFVTGCAKNEKESNVVKKNDIDTEVINVVQEYFQNQNTNQHSSVNEWKNASVKKIMVDETFKNFDHSYIGKEIFLVTKVDSVASPLVFVDMETFEVIAIMPGE
ncbi:hypothetical protein [Psychrobacillus sp. MER TA 171]|uniref:hypothetical protein n=1 Tax=Psychrobacillus sp. MER TA 171 TaxID=2939577 RepID=UPI00203AA598|nr:hypothetical protein [Psychrobacillus sp. MER TA 171]MCM3357705.1 hypothetical protein [Psychrobacillus sp. MER TA 171]